MINLAHPDHASEFVDFTERWITDTNWVYTADMTPFTKTLTRDNSTVLLVFYGIDTVANIASSSLDRQLTIADLVIRL